MQLVFITDIFGINQNIKEFVHWLMNTTEMTVNLIDPYQGCWQNFTDEEQAYKNFKAQCGHQKYTQLIDKALVKIDEPVIIIAFSAGASAAWQYIAHDYAANQLQQGGIIKHFIGFYPSQIRQHTQLTPSCPTTLIFPAQEPHFDLKAVVNELVQKEQVNCINTNYLHGFMNPISANYITRANLYFREQLSYLHPLINEKKVNELLDENFNLANGYQ